VRNIPLSGAVYQAKVYPYPDGGFEVVAYSRHVYPWNPGGPRPRPEGAPRPDASEENRERAFRRTKTKLRRFIRASGFDRMLTLTTRENSTEHDWILADWDLMRRRLRREYDGEFRYVAVVEPHPTNPDHLHIHIAVRGFRDANTLRRLWLGVLRRRGITGNVDIRRKRRTPAQMARYMAKYLSKTFEACSGKKGYWRSRGGDVEPTKFSPAATTWADLEAEFLADDALDVISWWQGVPGVLWFEGRLKQGP